jgi:hypothetical protein
MSSQLLKTRQSEVSLSLFSFLYSELLRSLQQKATVIQDLEYKLHEAGRHAGIRFLELFYWKERPMRRDTDFISFLQLIQISFWKYAFGKSADSLEVSTDSRGDYMIIDQLPITSRFLSVPKDLSQLSPAAWIAGIIEIMLHVSGFRDYNVSAHSVPTDEYQRRTVFLIRKQLDHAEEK